MKPVQAFNTRVRHRGRGPILDVLAVHDDYVHTVAPDGTEAAYAPDELTPVDAADAD